MPHRASAFAFAALVAACSSASSPEDHPRRLVSDDELAAMRRDVESARAANARARCPRPLLHGAAAPGNADDDLVALVEARGPLAACAEASGPDLVEALEVCPAGGAPATGPIAALCTARALDDPRSLEGDVMTSTMQCAALDDAVAGAVAHDDACSPYLPGRRAAPQSFRTLLSLAHALEVRARHLAQEGETAAALRLVLDWTRACQDLGRGGASLLPTMVATAAMQGPLAQAEVILASDALSPEEIDALAAAADTLLASEPEIGDVLAGEHLEMVLEGLLPALDGRGPPSAPSPLPTRSFAADPRDELALGWLAIDEAHQAERAACPTGAALRACIAALDRAARDAQAAAEHLDLRDALQAPAKLARRRAVAVLRGTAADARLPFVRRLAFRRARLGALRAHLEALRFAARTGACPTVADFSSAPLRDVLSPPRLGDALTATAAAAPAGGVDLDAPAWIAPVRAWTVRCPPPRR